MYRNIHAVRRFKNRQKQLAKSIAKKHGGVDFSVTYEQKVPSAHMDFKSGKLVYDSDQIVFPTQVVYKGKHRVIVVMQFKGKCNIKVVGKVLKRQFFVKHHKDGFEVRSSFAPRTIAKF